MLFIGVNIALRAEAIFKSFPEEERKKTPAEVV